MVKTVTISDAVYRKLKALKNEDERFSDFLERLADCHDSCEILTKLRGSVEFENKERLLSELRH